MLDPLSAPVVLFLRRVCGPSATVVCSLTTVQRQPSDLVFISWSPATKSGGVSVGGTGGTTTEPNTRERGGGSTGEGCAQGRAVSGSLDAEPSHPPSQATPQSSSTTKCQHGRRGGRGEAWTWVLAHTRCPQNAYIHANRGGGGPPHQWGQGKRNTQLCNHTFTTAHAGRGKTAPRSRGGGLASHERGGGRGGRGDLSQGGLAADSVRGRGAWAASVGGRATRAHHPCGQGVGRRGHLRLSATPLLPSTPTCTRTLHPCCHLVAQRGWHRS